MAQRATGFSKRQATPEGVHAEALVRAMESEEPPRAIPLDLAPLIAPYRRHGRLSLRVERLPPRARLSRGHNNGDRSWSLLSDELDDLTYLPPKGALELCTLGIRIVSLDGGDGGTLALIDYPLLPNGEAAPPAAGAVPGALAGAPAVAAEKPAPRRAEADTAELRRLREELAKAKAASAEAQAAAEAELRRLQDELARAKAGEAELIAKAKAASADPAELRRLRDELAKAKAALAERDPAGALAKARERWEQELQEQLASASALASETLERNRAAWQAEQAARFTRSEARAEERVADARREGEEALARAEQEWKSVEAQRLAAAEAQWSERSAKTRAAADSTRERADEAERKRLREEIARLKKTVAARDGDLAEARAHGQTALADAETQWREQEAERLAGARTQWQERSARALAEATAQFERAQARSHRDVEAELTRLRAELDSANEAIADRESDIADLHARLDAQEGEHQDLKDDRDAAHALAAERERALAAGRAEMEAALAAARKSETERVRAAETHAQESAQVSVARAAQRVKQLEGELQQARDYAQALQKRGDSDDIKQLRRDFAHLQSQLAERDIEVAQLKLDSEHARERWTAEARMSLQQAEHQWRQEAEEADREQTRALSTRRTIRDVALVAALSVVGMLVYLRADSGQSLFPASIGEMIGMSQANLATASAPAPAAAAPTTQPAQPMATIIRAANVRSAPSKTASVIATLPRDTSVASLERRGNWVKVRVESAKTAQEGWVYGTYLQQRATSAPAAKRG